LGSLTISRYINLKYSGLAATKKPRTLPGL
jgi:hypothetical protein